MRWLMTVVAAVTVVTALPSVAEALPYNCGLKTTTYAVSGYCKSGTGYYRVAASGRCNGGALRYWYAGWTRPGGFSASYLNAPSGCKFSSGFLQKKN